MLMAVEKSREVIEMQVTIPGIFRDLLDLREQVMVRVRKIEPESVAIPLSWKDNCGFWL